MSFGQYLKLRAGSKGEIHLWWRLFPSDWLGNVKLLLKKNMYISVPLKFFLQSMVKRVAECSILMRSQGKISESDFLFT